MTLIAGCSSEEKLHAETTVSEQDMLERNAQIWSQTFRTLYQQKQYSKLKKIDHMGKDIFFSSSIWQDQDFLNTWSNWSKQKAILSWEVGNGNLGMWKIAEGDDTFRPTMGLKREQNGQWWLVFVKPQNVGGEASEGWSCAPNCSIKITTNGVTRTVLMRPPQHQEFQKVHTIGAVAPKFLFTNQEQLWEVSFPNNEKVIFDVSFAPSICQKMFGACELKP